jgi:hydroxylamine reductase (hybrid-cluster protein)
MDLAGRFEDTFCNIVIVKGDGSSSNDAELFEEMKEYFIRLYNHPAGRSRVENLLNHENEWVRSWVAAQLLSEGNNKSAVSVLKKLSTEGGTLGFSAEMTLSEYNKGTLGSPFDLKP